MNNSSFRQTQNWQFWAVRLCDKHQYSVYCEQAFSFAGNIVTKSRSKLSDETIDDLCFEKSYFLKEN